MLGAGVFSNMWESVLAAGRWYLLALGDRGGYGNSKCAVDRSARGESPRGRRSICLRPRGTEPLPWSPCRRRICRWQDSFGCRGGPRGCRIRWTRARAACGVRRDRDRVGAQRSRNHAHCRRSDDFRDRRHACARGDRRGGAQRDRRAHLPAVAGGEAPSGSVVAVLVGASAAFFAFAGYARIATLSEEVRDPRRTVPRAIALALVIVFAVYALVAVALARTVGAARITAASAHGQCDDASTPIALLARVAGLPVALVNVVAVLAVFGALLAVMAGAGRTLMAMARQSGRSGEAGHAGRLRFAGARGGRHCGVRHRPCLDKCDVADLRVGGLRAALLRRRQYRGDRSTPGGPHLYA